MFYSSTVVTEVLPAGDVQFERTDAVSAAIDTLPPVRKRIMILKTFHGCCTEEEAAIVEASLLEDFDESDALTPLPEGYKEEMLEAIVLETTGKRVPKIR